MNLKNKPLAELTEDAIRILYKELGAADTVRFLRQFSTGFGNYTEERAATDDETLDEVLAAIKAQRVQKLSGK